MANKREKTSWSPYVTGSSRGILDFPSIGVKNSHFYHFLTYVKASITGINYLAGTFIPKKTEWFTNFNLFTKVHNNLKNILIAVLEGSRISFLWLEMIREVLG